MSSSKLFLVVFNLLFWFASTSLFVEAQELFTSSAELQRLVYAEKEIPKLIENYVQLEMDRLEYLNNVAADYQRRLSESVPFSNPLSVLNPLNAFRLIKQLAKTWEDIQKEIRSDLAEKYLRNISSDRNVRMPTEEDLDGAALGLLRLQDTYKLDTSALSNGVVAGVKASVEMTAQECFEIGLTAFNKKDFFHALIWLQEAWERKICDEPLTTKNGEPGESEILAHFAVALYEQGNVKRALLATEQLLEISPSYPKARENLKRYEQHLLADGVQESEFRTDIPPLNNTRAFYRQNFEALCRDEFILDAQNASKLYCYYKMDRPFLRLAPIKVEVMHFNPLAVLFREVVSDNEIEALLKIAAPKLVRSKVQNAETGALETASFRISKSAWLSPNDHQMVKQIRQRSNLMTNLDMKTAETLQIGNYGIGGHYDPHFDWARDEEVVSPGSFQAMGIGNRIATILFYVSQPEKGGFTVFPQVNAALKPSKNDALFWYNLMRNGKGDVRTLHAACPVLLGEKWVANLWIHERGQEFVRPCALDEGAEERFVGDLGGPEPRMRANISPL